MIKLSGNTQRHNPALETPLLKLKLFAEKAHKEPVKFGLLITLKYLEFHCAI
jgi:hypothetical protein